MSDAPLPAAKAYHHSGVGHCNAAAIVHAFLVQQRIEPGDSTWLSLQSIIGFAAENALKGYLASTGMERQELSSRRFGHNLEVIYDEALSRGLEEAGRSVNEPELAKAIKRFIDLCGPDYQSFNYRYLEKTGFEVLTAGEATEMVISALRCLLDIVARKLEADRVALPVG